MCSTAISCLLADLELDVREAVVNPGELFIECLGSRRDNVVLLVERYEHILHCVRAVLEKLSTLDVARFVNQVRGIVTVNGVRSRGHRANLSICDGAIDTALCAHGSGC